MNSINVNHRVNVRYLTATAMLSAIAFLLMFLEISIPIMPSFIKLDFSELPELIGAFAMGPWYGFLICLIKNLLHMPLSSSGFIGELSNFIMGSAFVIPAGYIYKHHKTKAFAFLASFIGALVMALISLPVNYFLIYPLYTLLGMSTDAIVSAYQGLVPFFHGKTLFSCLLFFNLPFTFVKGMFSVIITFIIYKHISPIIKGVH